MLAKIKNIPKIYRTVRHLKPIQVVYQMKNRLWKAKALKGFALPVTEPPAKLRFFELPPQREVLSIQDDQYIFDFLNVKNKYSREIDWNDQSNGKLWNYNQQYCDFLNQINLYVEKRAGILLLLYEKLWNGAVLPEPYPASLRIMNVIRFLSEHKQEEVLAYLHAEVNYLSKNFEYHLLGNHLLENAFALFMAGHFFSNVDWIRKASKLVKKEMEEQILKDGAHFELSPMYHQIILFRVLEAIHYLPEGDSLRRFLLGKAEMMMTWLSNMTFIDGSVPHFNDSTNYIAYTTTELMQIAKKIGLQTHTDYQLKESGYRKFSKDGFEMFIDVFGIGPEYQPGHAHADTFSYFLSYEGKAIFVEPGISTYDIGEKRDWERSTGAHNTVTVNGLNSSETWSGFRVGRRARVKITQDKESIITASHDGYRHLGISVHRQFIKDEDRIIIEDYIEGWDAQSEAVSYLHLHPSADIRMHDQTLIIDGQIEIHIIGSCRLMLEDYQFSHGYNNTEPAQRLRIIYLEPTIITQMKTTL